MYAVHGTPPATGRPGVAPSIGLPVFSSTFAAMAFQIGSRCFHESGSPPGMSDGPNRAPVSPPETPDPKNLHWLAYSFSRRMVSVHRLLPQSQTMSSRCTPD